MFVCPGCASFREGYEGVHSLPVNIGDKKIGKPAWDWDGNREAPTLSPSILSNYRLGDICHSFLKAGVFEFLSDSTHKLAGQKVSIPDLPDWVVELPYTKE